MWLQTAYKFRFMEKELYVSIGYIVKLPSWRKEFCTCGRSCILIQVNWSTECMKASLMRLLLETWSIIQNMDFMSYILSIRNWNKSKEYWNLTFMSEKNPFCPAAFGLWTEWIFLLHKITEFKLLKFHILVSKFIGLILI